MVSEQDSNGICLQGDNTGTTMNASANSQEDNGICGSDSDSNPDDTTDYYQPISSVGNGGGGGGGDFSGQDPNSTFHQLPNGWTENGVSSLDTSDDDADEDVVKEIEEEEIHFWLGLFLIAHATRKLKRNSPISGVKMLRFLGKTTESRARSGGSIPTEVCGVGDEVLSAWELVNVSQSDDEDLYSYDSDEAASTGDSVSADNLEQVPAEEDDDDDDDVNVDEDAAPSPDFMTASDIITIQAISVSPAMNFPVGMQCNYVDLGTLESDLQAALVALKKKEEDLQDAERKVASEFNEINFARKDLEQLEVDYGGYVRSNSRRSCQETYGLFAGWNLIWNNALKSRPLSSSVQSNEILNSSILSFSSSPQVYEKSDETLDANKVDEYVEEREMEGSLAPYNNEFPPACKESWVMGFNNEGTSCSPELQFGEKVDGAAKSEEAPHDAFKFCLMYLGVKDLFSIERVSSYLRSEVRGEPLLWKSIHIDHPLNEKITDDILLELACRADGTLQNLSLVECQKITDDCIKRILETNPRLTKLYVPGCTRLTIKGMLNNIWTHNSSKDVPGIKFLRIGGLYGVTREHFDELKSLLGTDDHKLKSHHRPHFYHRGNCYLPYDDDRAIDIEMCPRCEKFRLVYDCPSEGCRVKDNTSQDCRACTLCIARCAQCGTCINDNEYEETFCLDLVCSDCFKQLLKYQDRLDKKVGSCGGDVSLIT